jgi:hypothetical protein
MGVFKLTFPGETSPTVTATSKFSPFRQSSVARRFIPSYATGRVQPVAKATSLESPEMAADEDDATSVFTASTRTSDDDVSLADFAVRSTSDFVPARHSTACCTDVALRRELRRKFHVEPALAVGHSFRRELLDQEEDRVESLALWEESVVDTPCHRSISKDLPWHGDIASSASSRNRGLESLFRKPRKASSLSFFTGFFSGLPFSTSRGRSRKS